MVTLKLTKDQFVGLNFSLSDPIYAILCRVVKVLVVGV